MPNRIDIAISNALSMKITTVHGAAHPLDMMTAPPTVHGAAHPQDKDTVHGAANLPGSGDTVHGAAHFTANAGDTVHGAMHVVSVHGAIAIPLPHPQKVSRVEVRRAPNGDLLITLHE